MNDFCCLPTTLPPGCKTNLVHSPEKIKMKMHSIICHMFQVTLAIKFFRFQHVGIYLFQGQDLKCLNLFLPAVLVVLAILGFSLFLFFFSFFVFTYFFLLLGFSLLMQEKQATFTNQVSGGEELEKSSSHNHEDNGFLNHQTQAVKCYDT